MQAQPCNPGGHSYRMVIYDEAEIHALIQRWAKAVRDEDRAAIALTMMPAF